MSDQSAEHVCRGEDSVTGKHFPLLRLMGFFAVVAVGLWGVFAAADWYGNAVSLPRYCANPQETLIRVERILDQRQPAEQGETRDYAVAAKLMFVSPQKGGEPVQAYLQRLHRRIGESCR